MNESTKEKLAEIVAGLIFLILVTLLYVVSYSMVTIATIWVVKALWGLDWSDSFIHVFTGLLIIKAMQSSVSVGGSNEHSRKNR